MQKQGTSALRHAPGECVSALAIGIFGGKAVDACASLRIGGHGDHGRRANLWQWQFSDAEAGHRLALDKTPVEYAQIKGGLYDDHAAGVATFYKTCGRLTELAEADPQAVKAVCDLAKMLGGKLSRADARRFFEANFKPYLVKRPSQGALLTGYFELRSKAP